jgi:hypothetical protein
MELKELLNILDRRWKVAGKYLLVLGEYWNRQDLRFSAEEEATMRGFRVV